MKILIGGDYVPINRVRDLFLQEKYDIVFHELRRFTNEADYSIINLECPVCYGGEEPIEKSGPNISCSKNEIEALRWAGINCVTMANNHILDFGGKGVINTIKTCHELGIDTVGGGEFLAKASETLYKDIQGNKLAIINCCEQEFNIATKHSAGANPLNPVRQYYSIKEARNRADYVIVIVHGGFEHYQLPGERMQEVYRFFIDAGANAVLNHHQHCFSGYEVYNGCPIFYGLGNLCFDKNYGGTNLWHEGYMVLLTLDHNISYKIIPYEQCKDKPSVIIVDNDIYTDRLTRLSEIIANPDLLANENEKYFQSRKEYSKNLFNPIVNRYINFLQRKGIIPSFISKKWLLKLQNNIVCESHLDKLKYYFNNKD